MKNDSEKLRYFPSNSISNKLHMDLPKIELGNKHHKNDSLVSILTVFRTDLSSFRILSHCPCGFSGSLLTCICLSARFFVWPWKSRAPHVTLTSHLGQGAGCGRGRGTKIQTKAIRFRACYYSIMLNAHRVTSNTFKNINDTHNNNTCDMYCSSLRHIHDPVLSSLKMKGIRLLFTMPHTTIFLTALS
jgi:hypothetical protein